MNENPSYAESVALPDCPCVCGRSDTGKCELYHLLTEEQYQFNLQQAQQQAGS